MHIDLHCPIEHVKTEFTRDDRGNVRAYLQLSNLSSHIVERLDAVAVFEDGSGARAEVPFSMENLAVKPRAAFKAVVTTDELPTATRASIEFTRVIYLDDAPVFMYSAARMVEVPDLPRPDGRDIKRLIAAAGEDAVVFPIRTGQLWICVCSRANPYRRKTCRRCGRERDHVLNDYDMARLLSQPVRPTGKPRDVDLSLLEKKPKRAAAEAEEAKLMRRFKRERAMLIRRTITMLVLIALMLIGAWLFRRATERPQSIAPTRQAEVEAAYFSIPLSRLIL